MIRPAFLASSEAERIVPPTGTTAQLTTLAAAAMAFLCVFALALLYTTGRGGGNREGGERKREVR